MILVVSIVCCGLSFFLGVACRESFIAPHEHSFLKIGEFTRARRPDTFSMIPMTGNQKFANMFCGGCAAHKEVAIGGEINLAILSKLPNFNEKEA